jgi:hypothetical protein
MMPKILHRTVARVCRMQMGAPLLHHVGGVGRNPHVDLCITHIARKNASLAYRPLRVIYPETVGTLVEGLIGPSGRRSGEPGVAGVSLGRDSPRRSRIGSAGYGGYGGACKNCGC